MDPNALSQIVGALIGAGIAISLWYAERRRIENEKKTDELRRCERFRATLRSAVSRLKKELEVFVLQCHATRSEIEAKSEIHSSDENYSKSVTSFLERFPVNIPSSFEFSEIQVVALSENATELISEVKDSLQDMFVETRTLRALAGKPEGFEILLESLRNAAKYGAKSINLISELDRSLDGGVITRGI